METDTGVEEDVCCLICWVLSIDYFTDCCSGFDFEYCFKFHVDVFLSFLVSVLL